MSMYQPRQMLLKIVSDACSGTWSVAHKNPSPTVKSQKHAKTFLKQIQLSGRNHASTFEPPFFSMRQRLPNFGVWRSTGGPQVQVIVPALVFLCMCWHCFSSKKKKIVLPSLVLAAPPSRSILCFFRKASLNIIVLMPPPQQEPEHESLDRFYREIEAGWPCDQEGFARLSMFEGYKGPFITVFSQHLGNMFFVCVSWSLREIQG